MSKIKDLIQQHCPNGVEYKKLGEIFNYFSGMRGVSNKWKETGNCKFIDYLNVYNNMQVDVFALKNATVKNQQQNILRTGDILLTCASETPNECAITSVIRDKIAENTFLDDHLFALRTKEEYKDIIDTAFYNYYFHSIEARKKINKTVRGVTRFYIAYPSFMELSIPIPPMEVQEEIVRILDTFSALTAELEAELEARKKQYQYYRDKLLSFENLNGGGYKNVIYKTLGEIAEIGTGFQNRKDAISLGMYPLYVRSKDILRTNNYFFDEEAIIIPGEGGIGEIFHYINGKYGLHQRAYRVHVTTNELKTKFLYYFFKSSFKKFISSKAVNATVMSIRKPMLEQFVIPIPSMEEQERVVGILDKFERLVNDISEGIPAEIKARRQQYEYYRDMLLNFKKL